ncbi:uncharacterized protein si:ch1073-126c3.2 isoform X1 [Megalobrama amblycephala]|uniref:uncharacterized protein si:ch1073-126c3.2 isoform X1 n=1 Tax=Megalobrama amblycephala TaxID=75352 RepID=UPI0020141FD9|nr:uncharacterized protein si:ch1073-126c3.2 isoform X1 [Megalobrama amblycephala]
MKSTTIIRAWKKLCLLFAFLLTRAHGQNTSCSSSELSFEVFDKKIQDLKNCLEAASDTWAAYQNAKFFNELRILTDIIQNQQTKELQKLLPKNCSAPAVPEDGGLLCISVTDKIYCKPMCNAGYDFTFIRSRLFEECSAATQYKWTTQFIGGNRLAICIKSQIAVSGASSAYFPEGHDCHKIKSHEQLMENIRKTFQSELDMAGITQLLHSSILCG